jgi:peptidoglycan L-alanyl-D-glutamate endopeptidase CwlK
MPSFSQASAAKLATCDARLVRLFSEAVKHVDCTVLTGKRGKAEQDEAFETGHSKLKWPASKHNCPLPSDPSKEDPNGLSRAVDVAPYPIDWKDRDRFVLFAGFVIGLAKSMGIPLRWGGDWNRNWKVSDEKFQDLPHFELED